MNRTAERNEKRRKRLLRSFVLFGYSGSLHGYYNARFQNRGGCP
jgi:hypothetical protein